MKKSSHNVPLNGYVNVTFAADGACCRIWYQILAHSNSLKSSGSFLSGHSKVGGKHKCAPGFSKNDSRDKDMCGFIGKGV